MSDARKIIMEMCHSANFRFFALLTIFREAARDEKAARDNLEAIKVDVLQAEQDIRRLVPKVKEF